MLVTGAEEAIARSCAHAALIVVPLAATPASTAPSRRKDPNRPGILSSLFPYPTL
jgi:hypothetical protein